MTLLRSPGRPIRSPLYSPLVGKWAGAPFTPLSISPAAWYDPSDLSTLFQDSAGTTPVTANTDPVGLVLDKSGNDRHLMQVGDDTTRPLYKTDGTRHWLESDGVNDYLQALFTINQSWGRVSAIRQLTWVSLRPIYNGGTSTAGALRQRPASPSLEINSGVAGVSTAALAVGSDGVVTERHSGATSRIAINNGAYTTGDAGTTLPGGLTVFAVYTATSFASARFYGLIQWEGVRTGSQIAEARTWMGAKAGLSL